MTTMGDSYEPKMSEEHVDLAIGGVSARRLVLRFLQHRCSIDLSGGPTGLLVAVTRQDSSALP